MGSAPQQKTQQSLACLSGVQRRLALTRYSLSEQTNEAERKRIPEPDSARTGSLGRETGKLKSR
ncbi:hypothetical protein EI42_02780 [Thermosporothrix hazakensis]|jgi:hypothetical protein|uniref:Uncharacterized protein n=1 Tax=Thermosporothrix hazakensis TaxID=644383 RepID=A0A326UAH1_THEHA|nr:hypothetical protein [Thermosporothrix hazakensis]PZW29484.1 hypothetical protein EI42_02780 [Thermosporothrix hazakensis]GCE45801.1 hypothetical protein KTH_06700 [Thermosporothrix hazakensis]